MSHFLYEFWNELTKDLNEEKVTWWIKITNNFFTNKRKCHNIEYLENKFRIYLDIQSFINNRKAVEYALFFSYYDYEPNSVDKEEKNFTHFYKFCLDCGISPESDLIQDVRLLLWHIGNHKTLNMKMIGIYGNEDRHYFVDLDKAVLGSDPGEYSDYTRRIREEYCSLSTSAYKEMRVMMLKTLLDFPFIYATNFFRENFERQARMNIQEELELLQ